MIEVGAGHGFNFALYPDAVERVLAIEPEPLRRKAAIEAAAKAAIEVGVVEEVVGELPAADQSFDAGVASLVLGALWLVRRHRTKAAAETASDTP